MASVRVCCERNVLATLPRTRAFSSRILCYHSVGTPEWGVNDVTPAQFRRQIAVAREAGYSFAPAADVAAGTAGPRALAITFDDGLASVANVAPFLRDEGIPWSLFMVSDWAEGRDGFGVEGLFMDWDEVARVAKDPLVTIGSHSVSHPRFRYLEREQAEHELRASREAIRERIGLDVDTFAIPMGQSQDWPAPFAGIAADAGYSTVYAQADANRPANTVPRTFITRWDSPRVFRAALGGAFERWEEWV